MTTTLPDLQLHRVPEHLVPHEPRLGGSCVPVPASRFAALAQSGTAVLGLPPGYRHAAGFAASVDKELRALLRLPDSHACLVVPASAAAVAELVRSSWRTVDLSRTTAPVSTGVLGTLDVGFFCASTLFGLPAGLTVVTLSPRARAIEARLSGGFAPSTTDLMLLANAVRSMAEAEPGALEDAAEARFELVARWAAEQPWVAEVPSRVDHGLVAEVRTSMPPETLALIGDFLATHHLAYGVTDEDSLSFGLSETVPVDDLERLLGLLTHLVGTVG